MSNLTRNEIAHALAEAFKIDKADARVGVQVVLDSIAQALADGRCVELRGFGVFELQLRKARVGRNPNRPETDVEIPRRAVVKFKSGKKLKEALAQLDLDELSDWY